METLPHITETRQVSPYPTQADVEQVRAIWYRTEKQRQAVWICSICGGLFLLTLLVAALIQ